MATNPKALELAKKGKVEYDWGTLWPHYHKEKMNWGGGFKTKGDVDILFLSGETGRDPFEDAPCRTPEEERAGKGKVVSMDIKQQTRQCLEYIVVHEMAHLVTRYHDDRFLAIMSRHLPHWERYRDELNSAPLSHETWRVARPPRSGVA